MRHATILIPLVLAGCPAQNPPPEPAVVEAPAPPPEPPKPVVNPIPEGFHTLTPSIVVNDITAAVDFYTKALGAQKLYVMDGPDGKPMHGEIKIGDSVVMLSAENPAQNEKSPKTLSATNGSLHVYVENTDTTFQAAVAAGAKAAMPPADMWWGDRFGEVIDPFGHVWSIGTHQEDLTPDVMAERAKAATAAMAAGKQYKFTKGPATTAGFKPAHYTTVTPSLVVKGGADVVEFYKNAFDAKSVTAMLKLDGTLMHAELEVGDSMLMLAAEMATVPKGPMAERAKYSKSGATLGAAPVQIMLYVPDADAAITKAIGAGAAEVMGPENMFWGDRFGMVADPSGNPFGVATHIEDLTPEQIKTKMMEQMPKADAPAAPAPEAPAAPAPK